MTSEEYKNIITQKLSRANDCEEVEQIISMSIDSMKEKNWSASVISWYLAQLKDELKGLSPEGIDYIYWCNIKCAILYLIKMELNKIENEYQKKE